MVRKAHNVSRSVRMLEIKVKVHVITSTMATVSLVHVITKDAQMAHVIII